MMVFLYTGIANTQPFDDGPPEPPSENQTPTNQNFPKPDEVLVVYDTTESGSRMVKNHYMDVRNIPSVNQVGLTLPDSAQYGSTFAFRWRGNSNHPREEIVSHSDSASWLYYRDYIATPIEDYLNNTMVNGNPLSSKIKYIVLMRGLPIRLLRWYNYHGTLRMQASISSLLCLINQPDTTKNIIQLYRTTFTQQLNPLFGVDSDEYTMDFRFKSNHFENSNGWYMQYLVSWFHGDSYSHVIDIIDKSVNTDLSGNGIWIVDDHRPPAAITNNFKVTYEKLNQYGFNVNYDTTSSFITQDSNKVMGYVSWGVWAGMQWDYMLNSEFNFTNGSIFGSWESFNGQSFGMHREIPQGLLVDFLNMGGTCGSGHVHEPYSSGVTHQMYTFPAYALGYSIVDASYFGIRYIGWQNIVVGDPLSTIAWGKQTLYENKIFSDTNLVTGVVTIPSNYTLTFEDETVVNFRHDGFITGDGFVITEGDFTINPQTWSESVLKSRGLEKDVPRIIWGSPIDYEPEEQFIFRRLNMEDEWTLIAELDPADREYTDEYFDLFLQQSEIPIWIAEYKVVAIDRQVNEHHSNVVDYEVIAQQFGGMPNPNSFGETFTWRLSENYPNPFNPVTKINFEVANVDKVELKVYNVLGQVVRTLVNEVKNPGRYSVNFDARNLSSGIYFYTLRAGNFTDTKRMLLIK